MKKLIALLLLFSLFSSVVFPQDSSATSFLWNQAFQELNFIEQTNKDLKIQIESLQSQSEKDSKLLKTQEESLQVNKVQLLNYEKSLKSSETMNQILIVVASILGITAIGEAVIFLQVSHYYISCSLF